MGGAGPDPSTWNQAAMCNEQALADSATVTFTGVSPLGVFYLTTILVQTDPTVATTGGVSVESLTVGNLLGISFNQTSSGLNIGAGASPSILPGPGLVTESVLTAQYGHILMATADGGRWEAYQPGGLCSDGSMTDLQLGCTGSTLQALCTPFEGGDLLLFNTNTTLTNYSLDCGITVNFINSFNNTYSSVGKCIDTNIKSNCTGLKGEARSACVTANVGVCQAAFNIPSVLARN